MDSRSYQNPNGQNPNNGSYPNSNGPSATNSPYQQPGVSPQQLQHNNGNLQSQTLAPLSQSIMQNMGGYGSGTSTPRASGTPNPPPNQMNNYMNNTQPRPYPTMMPMTYATQIGGYRPPTSMASSTGISYQPTLAPAPPQNRMTALAPMPGGVSMRPMDPAMYMSAGLQPSLMDVSAPTHVVGSQGRRGILPSAPGRPPVTAGPGSAKTMVPAKDAEGKYPCEHCTKKYLHSKHLKRHMLRHTGDRPYMCVLCRDTFSRSDILKRHFQKCSIRRGNPTGASHLSHAQAHLKKPHPGGHKSTSSMSSASGLMGLNGMSSISSPGSMPFGVIPDGSVPDAGSHLTSAEVEQMGRMNNMNSIRTTLGDDRQALTGTSDSIRSTYGHAYGGGQVGGMGGESSGPGNGSRPNYDQGYGGGAANNMPDGMNPPAFSLPQGQNGHSYSQNNYNYASASHGTNTQPRSHGLPLSNGRSTMPPFPSANVGQQPGLEWPQSFHPSTHDRYVNSYSPNGQYSQGQIKTEPFNSYNGDGRNMDIPVKTEADINNVHLHGVYPDTYNTAADFPNWNFQNDPLHHISDRLLYFCFPPTNSISSRSSAMRMFLSADNIKHFIEKFSSFQGHFPLIHMPTFKITEAYDGLLLAMICIGAVYSYRISAVQVRDLMELAKSVIESNSQIYGQISDEQGVGGAYVHVGMSSGAEVEQISALFLMHILFTWHGNPLQREKARRQLPSIIRLARKANLTQPVTTAPYSALHQPNVQVEHFNAANFDWKAWVDQEKRSRLMYCIFLLDASMLLFFNSEPLLETFEIRLPLPADDAAWDARSSTECAEALGLFGPVAATARNPDGSRRLKQAEFHVSLRNLLSNSQEVQPGTTNIYSKFILVHALHIQLWSARRKLAAESAQLNQASSGSSTPLSQTSWVAVSMDPTQSGPSSRSTSGRGTPVDGEQTLTAQMLTKAANLAFDKWKKVWDEDMATQYPPENRNYRRFGFCRDGVHFYWLAKYLIENSQGLDWHVAPDQRFSRVIHLLKSVKSWVVSDSIKRNEVLGSVGDIDKDYGVGDLTLDMSQLFKPIDKRIDSPVAGIST